MVEAMRYKILSLCVWIALSITFISSCAGVDAPDLTVSQKYPVSLSATSGEQTKVSLNGTSVGWESADVLQITAVSQSGISAVSDLSVYSINETNDNIASFTGFVTMSEAPVECYFTHPAGNAMTVDPSKGKIMARFNYQDGTHKPFLYSKESYDESGISTRLKYAGAMLEVDVQVEGVCSLAFFGNQFEDMYPLYIDPSDGSYTKSDEMGYQIQVPVQREGLTYICVPPVKLEDGFSIVLVDESGNQMIRSFSDGTTGGYDFTGKEGYIIPITISGVFSEFGVSYSDLSYGHTYKDNLLSGTTVTFKMEKSGTPNTRIQEWGATLVDSQGKIVRSFKSNDGSALSGALVTLNTVDNYKLLTAGEYTFSPYYKIYGETVTLESKTITIPDPGVKITLGGYTSYDKYVADSIDVANNCANDTIYKVTASINVHSDIINSYAATLDGEALKASSVSGSEVSFGNLTRDVFKSYPYKVTVNVGNLTFENSREFHITGLPMETDFTGGSLPSGWGLYNGAKYSDSRVTFVGGFDGWHNGVSSSAKSPSFYLPGDISVITYADVCCKNGDVVLYVKECTSNDNSPITEGNKIQPHKISGLSSLEAKGYVSIGASATMSGDNKAIMFTAYDVPSAYNCGLYKVKIQYN